MKDLLVYGPENHEVSDVLFLTEPSTEHDCGAWALGYRLMGFVSAFPQERSEREGEINRHGGSVEARAGWVPILDLTQQSACPASRGAVQARCKL